MSRRLTRRQQWRIKKVQQERLVRAEKKQQQENTEYDHLALHTPKTGQVISNFGEHIIVQAENRQHYRCLSRQNLGAMVCGDYVLWQQEKNTDQGVICALKPRQNLLARPDSYGKQKLIASNIDAMFIVCAPFPAIHEHLLDRYLVTAEHNHFSAYIILNKCDLLNDANRSEIEQILMIYQHLGYPVIYTSIYHAIDQLKASMHNKTSIFVGQSGVGKSSLINTLLPTANIRTNAVSIANEKGTHTTSVASLYPLPDNPHSVIIDSPGIREFSLDNLTPNEIFSGFIEFTPYARLCRFRNCTHLNEPGCALQEAVISNKIHPQRLKSYQRIMHTISS